MIESIVIVDTETTGLDPATETTIELAGVLYNVRHRAIVESFATLICHDSNAAESINKITVGALGVARGAGHAWARLGDLVDVATGPAVYMAHRAEFDRGFIRARAPELTERLPWVCSKFDIEWPSSRPGASCVEMALAHGVPVVSAHRALTDCMLIARTLESVQASGHDLPEILARAMRPRSVFAVRATGFDAARNELAKAHGFRWEKPNWIRRMAIDDIPTLPFEVRKVEP